ncbi:MAG: RNA polymerase sigma factor [Phycisphaerae bacterium]
MALILTVGRSGVDESELIERCRRGDRQAQRAFYERFVGRVYAVLLRMTRQPEDAMDLTQETFIRALERLGQFDGRSSIGTWLYRVAVNRGLEFLRAERRMGHNLRGLSRPEAVGSQQERADERMDVQQALAELAPTDRAVLILRYQQGLCYEEIAEVLNCRPGTVASRLNRARQRLRQKLQGGLDVGEGRAGGVHRR